MEETLFHGRKISRFTRRATLQLVSIPTYPTDFFKPPQPQDKKIPIAPRPPPLVPDDDVNFRPEENSYSLTLFAKNRGVARKIYNEIARISGSGSTSPKHNALNDFNVSIRQEIVTLRGCLETLTTAINYLYEDLNYISKEKLYALSDLIDEFLDADTDSQSSESDSSTTESPRQMSPYFHSPNNSPRHT